MPTRLTLILSLLLLTACSSTNVRQVDPEKLISLREIAEDLQGIYYWDEQTGKGVVEVGAGWKLIALPDLDSVLLGGAELPLLDPVLQQDSDLYLSREFYTEHLKPLALAHGKFSASPVLAQRRPRQTALFAPIKARPTPRRSGGLDGWTVALDAGHGGHDQGASVGRVLEKQITLRVSQLLAADLRRAGARVVMTRTSDRYVGLDRRIEMARNCDLFVSIHANSCPHAHVRGVEVFIKSRPVGAPVVLQSRDLARRICGAISRNLGARNRGVKRNVRQLRVLRKSSIPAVLVEVGFLTNRTERLKLVDSSYQQRLARAVGRGILSHVRAQAARGGEE